MGEKESKIEDFREIARSYFQLMLLMPTREAHEKIMEGLFHNVCSMKYFNKPDDETGYNLVCSIVDWNNFVSRTQSLFENKLSYTRLDRAVSDIVCSTEAWPFTEALISQYIDDLHSWAEQQSKASYTALVPLYNLMLEKDVDQITLANSVLFSGSDSSLFAKLSSHERLKGWMKLSPDLNYLAIPVSGDSESVANIAWLEANHALAVLRFTSNWTQRIGGLNFTLKNDGSYVSLFPTSSGQFVYYDPQIGTEQVGMLNFSTNPLYFINQNKVKIFTEIYELDNLNYHFQREFNSVSRRIIRALELYDSGVRADSLWQSLYRYVASINTVVLQAKHIEKEMTPRLRKLIEFGGNYVGPMEDLDDIADNLTSRKWSDVVEKTAKPFKDFYILRGRIIHGDVFDPTIDQVHKVRVLANNAIRLMAKLAREFNWMTKSDVENWFNHPLYLPSLEVPDNVDQPE